MSFIAYVCLVICNLRKKQIVFRAFMPESSSVCSGSISKSEYVWIFDTVYKITWIKKKI